MKFECGDLERALVNSDLMPEAREHLKNCALCRREYRLWTEISSVARELHQEWESPSVWPNIRLALEAEPKPRIAWWKQPRLWSMAAGVALVAVLVPVSINYYNPKAPSKPVAVSQPQPTNQSKDFLTDQALQEVEKSETAYRHSIEKLSRLAEPKLEKTSSPAAINAREKLLMLDSAISETRANVASNRFNIRLQTALADLYREKQQTLQELLSHEHGQKN